MANDRGAILTVRAAVRGVIDFREARLRDVKWWRSVNVRIREMHRLDELTVLQAEYAYQCALVANGNLAEDGFKKVQDKASALFHEIQNKLRPWLQSSLASTRKEKYNELAELYRRTIGDPNDPAFAAKLQQESEENRRRRAARKPRQPEQLLDQRMRERAQHKRTNARRR